MTCKEKIINNCLTCFRKWRKRNEKVDRRKRERKRERKQGTAGELNRTKGVKEKMKREFEIKQKGKKHKMNEKGNINIIDGEKEERERM